MQVTHEEARRLIQLKADNMLSNRKWQVLRQHLHDCDECTVYADEIRNAEGALRSTMKKHWDHPTPLIQPVMVKARNKLLQGTRNSLATRSAIIGITMLFIGFTIWQFILSGKGSSNPVLLGVSPIPTPSLRLTSTQQKMDGCSYIQYQVRPGDTLESIARQFSTSREVIIKTNGLRSNAINRQTELIIPICSTTPTGTSHPPKNTITPITEIITYTPG